MRDGVWFVGLYVPRILAVFDIGNVCLINEECTRIQTETSVSSSKKIYGTVLAFLVKTIKVGKIYKVTFFML